MVRSIIARAFRVAVDYTFSITTIAASWRSHLRGLHNDESDRCYRKDWVVNQITLCDSSQMGRSDRNTTVPTSSQLPMQRAVYGSPFFALVAGSAAVLVKRPGDRRGFGPCTNLTFSLSLRPISGVGTIAGGINSRSRLSNGLRCAVELSERKPFVVLRIGGCLIAQNTDCQSLAQEQTMLIVRSIVHTRKISCYSDITR
jgi:hypothetical protein